MFASPAGFLSMVALAGAALVVLAAPAWAGTAADSEVSAGEEPAHRFARAVTGRAQAGWQLRDISVDVIERGDRRGGAGDEAGDESIALTLTWASKQAARSFTLELADDGTRVVDFRSRSVRVPREQRIYPAQAQLVAHLTREAPRQIEYECGSFFLGGVTSGFALDPNDYHVVVERHAGAAAPAALARMLSTSLASGRDLVSVSEAESAGGAGGDKRAVEFLFAGERGQIVRVELDGRDRVMAVELRRVAYVAAWQVYRLDHALLGALESRGSVSRIAFVEGGEADRAGAVVLDGQVTIDLGAFEVGEFDCPC